MSFRDRFNNENSYSERMLMLDPSTAKSRIFVGNIPTADMTKKDLEDVFSKYGSVVGITLNKGFGFVQYEDDNSALEAIKQEHGAPYRGKQMDVRPARVLDRAHLSRISPMGRGSGPAHAGDKGEQPPYRGGERERERSPIDRRSREPRDWKGDSRYDGYGPGKGPNGRDPYYARDTGFASGKEDFRPRRDSGGGSAGGGGSSGGAPVMAGYGNGAPGFGGGMYRGAKDFPGDIPPRGGGPGGAPPGGPMAPDYGRKDYPGPPVAPAQIAEADRANDCEIIVLNKKQREYAEVIERRLKKLGLGVDLLFPNEDIPIGRVLANISSRGSLYAIVVAPQNEEHRSLTLNILYGLPEEHRNMPLEDAVNLLARNFDAYCLRKPKGGGGDLGVGGRMGIAGGPVPFAGSDRHPDNIQALFTLLVEQRPLTVLQYDRVIGYLKEKREVQVRVELGESKPPVDLPDPLQKPNTQQQQELQHRILNILNSNRSGANVPSPGIMGSSSMGPVPTPVPAPTGVPPPANWPPSGVASGASGTGTAGGGNPGPSPLLSDPTVQKALDSLIQGDLLRKISSSSAAAASTASAVSSAASTSSPVVSSSVSGGTMLGNPPTQALFGAYASQGGGGGRRF
ncbi:nuclear receptor coactivator 5 [Ischnura elegans]|uniref:nuclear receptor coactivator 5 n=1 Tax=Ischnura elegans TaxID=197161 RepID=UPI001ED8BBD6|nr:nuclear receptor coactivator 5 [Ischnura elegans]XP_046396332.1 nuclear receptor coactivator 5 [Ischnura elegans]